VKSKAYSLFFFLRGGDPFHPPLNVKRAVLKYPRIVIRKTRLLCCAVLLFNLHYSHPMIPGYTYNYSHQGTSISQPCLSPTSSQSLTSPSELPPSLFIPSIPPSEIQPLLPPFRPTRHGTRPSPTSLLSTASATSRSATRSGRSRRPTRRSGGRRNRPRRRWR
jgi:hypothetical protein